ncbi:MAG: MEMO1 family protein [Euryarchaeota archaeon]|nr:MEMO1 family protein [Euryarchaeota archaeon]MBU4491292.1 MEMO1 family protein [Euryarchaeota archaeon]MCG2728352.1 MEMO1 family protein [Candidatus Methanoperedenaceae archaeon]
MRTPAVSGQFYPRSKNDLNREISQCLAGVPPCEKDVLGAVVPHAGYIYSGNTAAYVYSVLPKADTFVLLGPNHTGYGSQVSVSSETWSTPLGEVSADNEFIKALPRNIIDMDENAHKYEHSIEVQLPFLQHRFREFSIVPVCMGMQDEETALDVGMELAEAARKVNKKLVIIASSDFTHYMPDKVARENDAYYIQSILDMDISGFYRRLYERNASVCGYGAIAAMLAATKALGAKKAALLKYSTSGDTTRDLAAVVGYAGIIVE